MTRDSSAEIRWADRTCLLFVVRIPALFPTPTTFLLKFLSPFRITRKQTRILMTRKPLHRAELSKPTYTNSFKRQPAVHVALPTGLNPVKAA